MLVTRRWLLLTLGVVAVLGLSLGVIALYSSFRSANRPGREASATSQIDRETRIRCETAISSAERSAKAAVAMRAKQFHDFVADRQYRRDAGGKPAIARFVDDLLSLRSKGRLLWAKMPFTDRNGYEKHVTRLFSTHLFSSEELAAELKRDIEEALKDVGAIENQLAVELREIISDSPAVGGHRVAAAQEFSVAMQRIVAAGEWDGTKDVGNLVTAEIASAIGMQVLVRVGVSAGILSAGAASSAWTFGAGAVVGILADLAWGWIDNPEADIQRDVLQATSKLAIDGMNALNAEFAKALRQRVNLWRLSSNQLRP